MKFIKRFELYLESVNNIKNYNGFTIKENLNGDVVFFDFKNNFKVLANLSKTELLIITFLSKDQDVNGINKYEII